MKIASMGFASAIALMAFAPGCLQSGDNDDKTSTTQASTAESEEAEDLPEQGTGPDVLPVRLSYDFEVPASIPPKATDLIASSSRLADIVVLATVVEVESFWGSDGTIESDVRLAPTETLLGDESGEFKLRVAGGRVGDVEAYASAEPNFLIGEEALFFVRIQGDHLRTSLGPLKKLGVSNDEVTIVDEALSMAEVRTLIHTAKGGDK